MKFSKSLFIRLFWFVLGGVLSIGINVGLFWLFHEAFGWTRFIAYALSLAIINVLLFLWNYIVGFKTDRGMADSAWRQGVCLVVTNALNYGLVVVFQGLYPEWKEAIIAVVQVFIAFFKFGLYNYWVFPQRESEPAAAKAQPSEVIEGRSCEKAK